MIKLEALRVFVTVAEAGNIKTAAEHMGRTPSAVSMALKQLEAEVGGALFASDRKNNLSALGAFMLETGRVQIANFDKAVATIRAFAQGRTGRLTLACVPSVAANLIPSLFPPFVEGRTDVEVELFDSDSDTVCLMVEKGQADMGIAGKPGSGAPVTFRPLFRDRFKVVCSSSSRLARLNRPVRWSDLQGAGLIVNGASKRITAHRYLALAEGASMTVRNVTSLIALVKAQAGVTLLPALATLNLPAGLVAVDLADASTGRVVGLIERNGTVRSPVAVAFRAFLLNETPVLAQGLGLENA